MTRAATALLLATAAGLAVLALPLSPAPLAAAQKKKGKGTPAPAPAVPAKPQAATPADTLKVAKGFKVELLYSVPKDQEVSWVNLCHDPRGRLIVSDQYGALYRVTPPAVGEAASGTKIEKIVAPIGS